MEDKATENRVALAAEERGASKGTTYPHDLSAVLKGGKGRSAGTPGGSDAYAKACADRSAELRAAHCEEGPPKIPRPLVDGRDYLTEDEAAAQDSDWTPTTWDAVRRTALEQVTDDFTPEEIEAMGGLAAPEEEGSAIADTVRAA